MFDHPVGNQLSTSNFDDKLRRITFDDSGVFRFDVLEHGRLSLVAALSTGHLGIVLGSGDDRQIKEALALDIFKTPKISNNMLLNVDVQKNEELYKKILCADMFGEVNIS